MEFFPDTDPQLNAFYDANKALNFNLTDVNSPNQIGVSPKLASVKNGRRFDDGTAFVKPILGRKNLKVMTDSFVIKINFKFGHAESVTFTHKGRLYVAHTRKEIIVSAGSINTPQLLMLSGIGPRTHLQSKNIHVIKDAPVGMTYREQPMYWGLIFSTNYSSPNHPFEENVRELLNGTGPLTVMGAMKAYGFYNTKLQTDPEVPDLEIMYSANNCTDISTKSLLGFTDSSWNATFTHVNPSKCFIVLPIVLNPKSVGSVTLKNNDPYEFPIINPNHLAEVRDMETMYEGVKLILRLAETDALKKLDAKLGVQPLPACSQHEFMSQDYFYCSIQQLSGDIYHPVGTCSMGPDHLKHVVDHELRVHGVKKLRIADASIFPTPLAGHPNAPCVMIGEKLGDIIQNQYEF